MYNKTLLENKLKPKKRIYNPYLNDEEYQSVDEKQSIKEKSKNPFWVPTNNAEVFEVRDIMRQEKEKKRLINRKKQILRNQDKDSFDKNLEINSNKYDQKSFYLTEQKFPEIRNRKINYSNFKNNNEESNTDSNYLETFCNTMGNINTIGTKILENIKEKKEKEKVDDSEKNQSDKLQEKVDMMANRRKDSVRDYIKKTRDIILTKYTNEIKKERAIRLKETYQNEIESIKDSIVSMQKTKYLFEEEFFTKFERYVKYLQFQKEKEKNELNNLLDDKNKIEIEVVKLENKIIKQKEKLIQYSEYRDFLICIKERKIHLPDFFIKMTNMNLMSPKENVLITNNYNNTLNTENSKTNIVTKYNKSSKNIYNLANINNLNNQQIDMADIDRYNGYLSKNIFDSASELNEELKKMEIDNITSLEKLNDKRANMNELRAELKKIESEEKKNNEYICKDIILREKFHADLKEKNCRLIEEKLNVNNEKMFLNTKSKNMHNANKTGSSIKSFFSKTRSSNMSFTKTKFNQNMIISKITNIFQCCLELKINKITNFDKDIIDEPLFKLKIMEKSLDFLLERQYYYLSDPEKKVDWDKKKSELDKERKVKKAKELKYIEELKREQLTRNINERNNRLLVIPRKKVAEKFKPDDYNRGKFNDKNNDDENSLADLLYN